MASDLKEGTFLQETTILNPLNTLQIVQQTGNIGFAELVIAASYL